jgi:hypothetical protein
MPCSLGQEGNIFREQKLQSRDVLQCMVTNATHIIGKKKAKGTKGSVLAFMTWRNKGGIFTTSQGCITMMIGGRSCLVGVGHTLAMLCRVAKTWDEHGNDCIGCALRISTASDSDVTSCSNENPIITPFFLVAYLE